MAASTQTCAVIMAPADQQWWWYTGVTGQQVGQLLAQNKARLTDISPYIDVDGTLKFAVIMAPADQQWWWYWGLDDNELAQTLNANHARLAALTPMPNPVTKLSWGPLGTGPLSDSATAGSGGNKCQYQVSVSIQQDGTCDFSGYYENRGDVPVVTAPPQAYIVTMIVLDTAGKGYTFIHSGEVPSAPQQGSVAQWNITQNHAIIAGNWNSIAARNQVQAYWWNNYDESLWDWLSQVGGSALNWIEQNAGTIEKFVEVLTTVAESIADPLPRLPLPAGVPTGAAAVAGGGGSSGPQASAAPAGNPAPPIGTKIPIEVPQAAATPGS
jgi:hypothetical protein